MLGFKRGEGAKSAYYTVDGDMTTRTSDHSANAELFVQDGTANNLSIVIRRSHDRKRFNKDNSINVIEAVFSRTDLESNPEKLAQIIRDIGEFIATGEYHDTAGAMAYNFSGDVAYQAKARDVLYLDAVERGDMDTAQRMVREAAAKAMPNTKVVDEDGLPLVVYRGDRDAHNDYTGWANVFHVTKESTAKTYGDIVQGNFINAENPLVVDADEAEWLSVDTPRSFWCQTPQRPRFYWASRGAIFTGHL